MLAKVKKKSDCFDEVYIKTAFNLFYKLVDDIKNQSVIIQLRKIFK